MKIKFTSVDVTPQPNPLHRKTKWLEYYVNGIRIAHAHTFMCNGRFNAGRIGRTFDWNHTGLEQLFGTEKYQAIRDQFVSPRADLVYGVGKTIPFKTVKEKITAALNS